MHINQVKSDSVPNDGLCPHYDAARSKHEKPITA